MNHIIKKNWFRGVLTVSLAGGLLAVLSAEANAQAWVEEKGTLSASMNYTVGTSSDLVDPDGNTYDLDLGIINHTTTLGASYAPMERVGLSMALPLLLVKYTGEQTGGFPPHGDYDDGDFHFTPTDFRFAARYQVLEGSKTFAPHIGVSVPAADYEVTGYAGGGRHIFKGHFGLSGGAVLDPWLPNAFVHLTTEFSVGSKVKVDDARFEEDALDEYGQSYYDIEFAAGYFISDKLSANAVVAYHQQLDGVTFNDVNFGDPDSVLFDWHDAVLKETYMHPGLDVAYQITPELGATAYVRGFVSGTNTRNVFGGGVGLSYTILAPDPPVISDDWYEVDEDWSEEDIVDGGGDDAVDDSGEVGADSESL